MTTEEYLAQLNGTNRFFIATFNDAKKLEYQTGRDDDPNIFGYILYERTENGIIYHGDDMMEPEDAIFARDLWWIVELLNKQKA